MKATSRLAPWGALVASFNLAAMAASQGNSRGPVIIETYEEDFQHFDVNRPHRW